MSPRRQNGNPTVIAVDPGSTTGLAVLAIDARWLRGQGPASWEGLGAAIRFKAAYQIGRIPRAFDFDRDRSVKVDTSGLDEALLPVLAANQPLLGDGEFDGRGRRDAAFYAVLNGDASRTTPTSVLNTVDAGEVLQVRQMSGLFDNYPDAALVIEDFQLRIFNQDREVLAPARLRLALQAEEALHGGGRVPFLQQPSEAKTTAPDERLKRANLYFAGMPHATDASRHAAVFFRRLRASEEMRAAAFPRHFKGWEDQ